MPCIGEGNGNPLQCSCRENPRDGRAWWAAVYGVARSLTRLKGLSSSSSSRPRPGDLSWCCESNFNPLGPFSRCHARVPLSFLESPILPSFLLANFRQICSTSFIILILLSTLLSVNFAWTDPPHPPFFFIFFLPKNSCITFHWETQPDMSSLYALLGVSLQKYRKEWGDPDVFIYVGHICSVRF